MIYFVINEIKKNNEEEEQEERVENKERNREKVKKEKHEWSCCVKTPFFFVEIKIFFLIFT